MARMVQNSKNRVKSNGKRTLDVDINGIGGEIAVCRYLNRFPDLSIGPHHRGYDLVAKNKKIDVKTTTYNPGYLQAKINARIEDADIYILVHAHFPEFTILGGASADQLINQSNVRDMGYGQKYVLEQSQLQSLRSLFA